MKLDKIRFSFICVLIQGWLEGHKSLLSEYDISELDRLIDLAPPTPTGTTSPDRLNDLLLLMKDGTRIIEAIKVYRDLTGCTLKESKDAVEAYWVSKNDA